MLRLISVTALVLAGACTLARADVFRWTDSDGVVHYSDEWVPGSVVIKTVRPHPESGGAPSGPSTASAGNRSQQVTDPDNARATQQDVARMRDAQCTQAKQRYMKAIESRRVYKEGKDGQRDYMSDSEADAYREQARKDVQMACGSVPEWKPDQPIPEPKPIPEPQVKPAEATSP
ncbi:MAG: DUF4124 domain-containing protein [Steroidobacteraceae bacterium]